MSDFLEGYKVQLGKAYDVFSVDVTTQQILRIVDIHLDKASILQRLNEKGVLLRKIPYLRYGYIYEAKFPISSMQEYLLGYFYIQDAPSQFAVDVLNPQEGELVLDMCAAPGSKTTYISQLMRNTGNVIGLDLIPGRLRILENNIERLRLTNIQLYQKDARFVSDFNMTFDRVLLDAPCSGNFTLDEDWFQKRSRQSVRENVTLQKQLLKDAVRVLKDNGILVYSTCSLEKEEDEEVVEWALETLPLELVPLSHEIGLPGCTKKTQGCIKFWPHLTQTQGFFVAKFKKL